MGENNFKWRVKMMKFRLLFIGCLVFNLSAMEDTSNLKTLRNRSYNSAVQLSCNKVESKSNQPDMQPNTCTMKKDKRNSLIVKDDDEACYAAAACCAISCMLCYACIASSRLIPYK
jgi:hypothetical protein